MKKAVLVLALIFLGLIILTSVFAYPAYTQGKLLLSQTQQLAQLARAQDLGGVSSQIASEKQALDKFKSAMNRLGWTQWIPVIGSYWKDANHAVRAGEALLAAGDLSVATIMPYADIIGLKGSKVGGTSQEKAQDRIAFVVATADKLAPQLEVIGGHLATAQKELIQINPDRYPQNLQGIPLRETLVKGIDLVSQASLVVGDAKPILEISPWLLGNDKKRTYLILFQNDAELRPTGGFWTGYALVGVDKGKVTPIFSGDIYDLDARYTSTKRAPKALTDYIAIPYRDEQKAGKVSPWRLRDMNLSPDYRISVETFLPEYLRSGGQKVDGVIAIDSQVLVSLLKALGTVGVPGWGNFNAENDARCNCPQVIYQLESIIGVVTPYMRENRKGVIGPLMHSVLANAIGSPKDKLPALFEVGLTSVLQKHVLFYFPDEKAQAAVESFNLAGRVRETKSDYLFIVDSNMAGAKSNLYVQEEVSDIVEVKSNSVVHNLTINYKNAQKDDQWLNGPYRDWFRVYVPRGAKLINDSGSELPIKSGEDLGKTTFDGFFAMRPLGIAKLTFKYEVPLSAAPYSLLVQKQPGTIGNKYSVTINNRKNEFSLLQDKELRLIN
jgi:hypothetical protein